MTSKVAAPERAATPKPSLSVLDAVALIVGIVVGAGIFRTPSLVASNTASTSSFLLAWLLGGLISFIGALCYAELATTYPHAGGDYHYFTRAFGRNVAFLFAWARLTIIQTGSIVILAFIFGDYVAQLLPLSGYAPSLYAAIAVILLTWLNLLGVQQGKWTQNLLSIAKVAGLLLVIGVGLTLIANTPIPEADLPPSTATFGSGMIFVLLTYGGWNEAAYISAELRGGRRNMVRALLWSIGIITAIFLLVNLAYLKGLGLTAMGQSEVVAADLMRRALGEQGARFVSALIAIAVLGATNATIFTGARTNYALGQDFTLFGFLGRWDPRANTPMNALIVQGGIALLLVMLGTLTRRGFETMVDYTAPAFWFFFLLTGVSLFVLRYRDPEAERPFQVPLYPLTPLLFCATSAYLLYSSLAYVGIGAIASVVVLVVGIPMLWLARRQQARTR